MGNIFGNIGNAIKGAANTAVGVSPYVAQAVAQRNQAEDAQRKQQLSEFYQKQQNDRANAQSKIAQQLADAKGEGAWGNAFNAEDASGPGMFQQHKVTGEVRRVTVSGSPQSGGTSTGTSTGPGPSNTEPPPSGMGMIGPNDDQSGAQNGVPALASPLPQEGAPSSKPSAPRAASGTPLRPYVKPVPPKPAVSTIPYNLTPAGITADSTRAAKVAQAQEPYKKDPNAAPAPSFTPVTLSNPDGSVTVKPFNTKTGTTGPSIGGPKPSAAAGASGAMSGQTMQTMARMGTSYNDLKQAIDQMDLYENTPGNLAKQTAGKQALGAASEVHPSQEAHGLLGAINNAAGAYVGAKAGEKIGKDDPEYRTYLNNKQRVATAFTELLPRPNQALLQLEKGLSGADVSWNPTLIQNIQARRRGGLDVLKNILGSQNMLDAQGNMSGTPASGGRGNPQRDPGGNVNLGAPHASGATHEQQLWDAAVAKHGQAKVLQEYGPRPEGDE